MSVKSSSSRMELEYLSTSSAREVLDQWSVPDSNRNPDVANVVLYQLS